MKNFNFNLNLKLKLSLIIIIFISIFTIKTPKAEASWINIPVEVSHWIDDRISNIQTTIDNTQKYIVLAKNLANTYKSSKALIQQVKNMDLSNFALNVGSDQILDYGQATLGILSGDQGSGVNVNTNGNQVITNLGNYLDKVGVNEIRKAVEDFKNPINTTPYSDSLNKAIADFSRNIGDTKVGKLVTFTLPYIARSEICNDPKLKDIIKNGEPADYINPKKAVNNVDIEKACQTPNIMSARDQATFVALAKAGYGGDKTGLALTDPSNTESGVIGNALSKVIKLKESAEDVISKQTTATGLTIGQQSCFDKSGKLVKYDPASKSDQDKICYSTNSSPDQSGAVVKDRTAAALLSPYFSMLARASATTNQTGDCFSGSKRPEKTTGVPTDAGDGNLTPPLPNSTGPITLPNNMPSYNPQGYHKSILDKVFTFLFPKAFAVNVDGLNDVLGGITKTIGCVSKASQIMNNIVGVLNIGGENVAKALTGEDNPYSRLADNFDSIINGQNDQNNLYADAYQSKQDYLLGRDGYSVDDLKNYLEVYQNIRSLNTTRLNEMVFTYAFVNLAIANSKAAIPPGRGCGLFSCKKGQAVSKTIGNIKTSLVGLQEAAVTLNKNINSLIKEMSKNNWKEQQMNKLLNQFQTTNTRAEDNQETLSALLGDALTQTDYTNLQLDWQYIPKFSNEGLDPNTIVDIDTMDLKEKQRLQEEARQTAALILPVSEKEGPYTDQNLGYLRIRA